MFKCGMAEESSVSRHFLTASFAWRIKITLRERNLHFSKLRQALLHFLTFYNLGRDDGLLFLNLAGSRNTDRD